MRRKNIGLLEEAKRNEINEALGTAESLIGSKSTDEEAIQASIDMLNGFLNSEDYLKNI